MKNYTEIMEQVSSRTEMNANWKKYKAEFSYAADIVFQETCAAVRYVMGEITNYQPEY